MKRTLSRRFLHLSGLLFGILVLACSCQCDTYTPKQSPSSSSGRWKTPFIRKQDMTGIWRVTHQQLSLPTTSKQKENCSKQPYCEGNVDSQHPKIEDELVLRLNDDGSFGLLSTLNSSVTGLDHLKSDKLGASSYSLEKVLSRGGSWTFQDGSLILAPDRPGDSGLGIKVHDFLLAGRLNIHVSESLIPDQTSIYDVLTIKTTDDSSETRNPYQDSALDVHLSVPFGNIKMGKFMYPRRHKAFFDEPMLFPESSIGTFSIQQVLGNLNARLKQQRDDKEKNQMRPKFHRKDFYNRRFYLTATLHVVDPSLAAQDKHYDESKVKYDVRVMPITFHSNNTFTALCTEKVLRGRFGITGDEGDKLWFQVNLFGFGRSAPGSVFSEGRLLSHDDVRGYLGRIQKYQGGKKNQTMYFAEGEFYYGQDLKRANKAFSWGLFSLQQVVLDEGKELDEDDDDIEGENDNESLRESLFAGSEYPKQVDMDSDDNLDAFQ